MKEKIPEKINKLTPRGYNPAIVGITLWNFFHILQKIEEEQEEENDDGDNLSQSI